jgi:hypothetical protein
VAAGRADASKATGRRLFGGGDRDRSSEQDRGFAGGSNRSSWGGGGGGADTWGGSGFGGPDDNGRRFDRIDPGHVGAQGAHPMSSPVDAGYGAGAGSYSRSAAIMSQSGGGHGGGIDPQARDRMLGRSGGGQSSEPRPEPWRRVRRKPSRSALFGMAPAPDPRARPRL